MQVFQQVATDKYGVTFVNTDLTECFDVFLPKEQLEEKYEKFSPPAYYFQGKHACYKQYMNENTYLVLASKYYLDGGAVIRYIHADTLVKDAVAGLADGAKIWPFDQVIDHSNGANLVTFNPFFKQHGVQYSGAKKGFVKAQSVADKKLPIGLVNEIKRLFVYSCVALLKKKAPGVFLEVDTSSNDYTEAGCSLMKQLGFKLKDISLDNSNWNSGTWAENRMDGLKAIAKHLITKAELTTDHEKELIKTINDWWKNL